MRPNRLINEKSLYLRQHAYNPVDWYPWGEEAFTKAQREDKPIFLSIGYSSCHWCHVMERECFEDIEVAELLNRYFVSIKVDREERPEIDHIYMSFCQLTNGSGGWPLNVFLTPDRKPFLALTYIPKRTAFNRVGMLDLLPLVHEAWINKRDELVKASMQAINLMNLVKYEGEIEISDLPLKKAFSQIRSSYDPQHGGFGSAPKFPMPSYLMFLMRYFYRYCNQIALQIVTNTLLRMRLGGIYDHVGYGFHRYSTDNRWILPHFEKMLYDQALLALAYLEAYQETKEELFKNTVDEILTYVIRDLQSSEGGFYASEDADSEGMEGRYYLWTLEEIRQVLSKEDFELALEVFDLSRDGNYLEEATGKKTGYNIIYLKAPFSEASKQLGILPRELKDKVSFILKTLQVARQKRVRCNRDNKLLTDWNSLMIWALSKAALCLDRDDYLISALNCYEYLKAFHLSNKMELYHAVVEREPKARGLLEDYAAFVNALISLYEATLEEKFLKEALDLSHKIKQLFVDPQSGTFFMTEAEEKDLIIRPKQLSDGVVPSGNSMALLCLIKLYNLTGEALFKEWARDCIKGLAKILSDYASSVSFGLWALELYIGPTYTLEINRGSHTKEIIREIFSEFLPNLLIKAHQGIKTGLFAHICQENTCGEIITDRSELLKNIKNVKEKRPC